MPIIVEPAQPSGWLSDREQPRIDVDHELAVRPWRDADAGRVRAAFAGPEIQRWHMLRVDSDAEALAWIARWPRRWADETAASWAIVASATDLVLGQVGLRTISLFDASASVSYWVLPEARGHGVAPRAARALVRWGFDLLELRRIELRHSAHNDASCRVAGKAGFVYEGTTRAAALHADGWHDMHVHAQVRD